MNAISSQGTPIHVKFVTEIKDGNRKENVAFDTNGLYYIKGSSTYLSFDEPQEAGPVKTKIKITDSEVLILRSGQVKMRQVFRKKAETIGSFENQLGTFQMLTKTNNIEYNWYKHSNRGKLFLAYELSLQGEKSGRYAIHITFNFIQQKFSTSTE